MHSLGIFFLCEWLTETPASLASVEKKVAGNEMLLEPPLQVILFTSPVPILYRAGEWTSLTPLLLPQPLSHAPFLFKHSPAPAWGSQEKKQKQKTKTCCQDFLGFPPSYWASRG